MVKPIKKKRIKAGATKKDFLDLTAFIRSIQRAEGNQDCFGRPPCDCDQLDCEWRKYCLEEYKRHCHDDLELQEKENRSASRGST